MDETRKSTRTKRPPDRYSPPPLPVRRVYPKSNNLKKYRAGPIPMGSLTKKRKKKGFWHRIKKKTDRLIDLEREVFGIGGIWRLIKSFIFRPVVTGLNGYPLCRGVMSHGIERCPNNATIVERCTDWHRFEHHIRGKMEKGRFPKWQIVCYRCRTWALDYQKYWPEEDDDLMDVHIGKCSIC